MEEKGSGQGLGQRAPRAPPHGRPQGPPGLGDGVNGLYGLGSEPLRVSGVDGVGVHPSGSVPVHPRTRRVRVHDDSLGGSLGLSYRHDPTVRTPRSGDGKREGVGFGRQRRRWDVDGRRGLPGVAVVVVRPSGRGTVAVGPFGRCRTLLPLPWSFPWGLGPSPWKIPLQPLPDLVSVSTLPPKTTRTRVPGKGDGRTMVLHSSLLEVRDGSLDTPERRDALELQASLVESCDGLPLFLLLDLSSTNIHAGSTESDAIAFVTSGPSNMYRP